MTLRLRVLEFAWVVLLAFGGLEGTCAEIQPPAAAAFDPIVKILETTIENGQVVGAQVAIGDRKELLQEKSLGRIAPVSPKKVDGETLFCIASCSKPIAATCILSLVDDKILDLDSPLSKWLPEFCGLKVRGGAMAERVPNLRELLAHRGGIYSQREKLSSEQQAAIRDFTKTLEQSVQSIARQELLSQPGSKYAYSGAGYCAVGRAVEVAVQKSFEEILQERLARPLGLTRTSYFPAPTEKNIAVGGRKQGNRTGLDGQAPLGQQPLRLALVGGSIHTTAREYASFARMIVNQGRASGKQILSGGAWREMTRRQFPDQPYTLGWTVEFGPQDRALGLRHGGSLASYRSLVQLDLRSGYYLVANWTLADSSMPEATEELPSQLLKAWRSMVGRLGE